MTPQAPPPEPDAAARVTTPGGTTWARDLRGRWVPLGHKGGGYSWAVLCRLFPPLRIHAAGTVTRWPEEGT